LRFRQPALRQHLEGGILPALALYQTLREEGDDQEAALAEIDQILAAMLERSGRRQLVQILGRLPDPFAVLRIANRWAIKHRYPPEGWRFEWVEDSDHRIAYDARECFYVNVLTAYGAPELTAHLCVIDDLLYGDLPGIAWERTKTLSRGDDRCDFRFRRVTASDVSKKQR
ncbi:MAG: L-2-amino-thiazoline-4-carboxylic acid hydrolase, partial [Chloroflexi bacterium]|nr:L-2-amino-thiazoline-4-carboxylic acid hydrolase [Chloroflexota bacterium]